MPDGEDPAEVEHVDAVAHGHHEADVVLDEEDGDALGGQLAAAGRRSASVSSSP